MYPLASKGKPRTYGPGIPGDKIWVQFQEALSHSRAIQQRNELPWEVVSPYHCWSLSKNWYLLIRNFVFGVLRLDILCETISKIPFSSVILNLSSPSETHDSSLLATLHL